MSNNTEFYELFAAHYERIYEAVDADEAVRQWRLLLEKQPRLPGQSLLDVGCGPGWYLKPWKQAGFRVSGLDASPSMLRRAARSNQGVALYCADMLDSATLDPLFGNFAVLVAHFNFLNLFSPDQLPAVLTSATRLLGDRGICMMDFSHRLEAVPESPWRRETPCAANEVRVAWKLGGTVLEEQYWRHAPEQVEAIARDVGFSSISLWGWRPDAPENPWCQVAMSGRALLLAHR